MTTPFRRRVATRRPAVLLSVTNRWQVIPLEDGGHVCRREVTVRTPAGEVETRFLPDAHPAVESFLARVAA